MKAKRDETLEEIWAIRRQIAQEFGYDPKKQVGHYQRKQKEVGAKIYHREEELSPPAKALTLRETPPGRGSR